MRRQKRGKAGRQWSRVPKPQDTASVQIDYESKRVIFVKNDVLINQLYRDGPKIRRSFDRLAKRDLEETSALIARSMGLCFKHLTRFEGEDVKAISARLLASSISAFIAGVEVARHGFR